MEFQFSTLSVRAFLEADNAFEVCKKIAFQSGDSNRAKGAAIHIVDVTGRIRLVAHFGQLDDSFIGEIYSWESHPLSRAIGTNELVAVTVPIGKAALLPLNKNGAPLGVLSIFLAENAELFIANEGIVELISITGGRFLSDLGVSSPKRVTDEGFEQWRDLTSRQIQVLAGMSQGMTNAEIARELLLSESTIRQETVRIFRALQVSGRIEAAKKAKALGLLGVVT